MADQFKAGDYIVILRPKDQDSSYIKYGHCYKQRSNDSNTFNTARDSSGCGCDTTISFEREEWWRYATPAEILEYQRKDKPFDTNKFTPKVTDDYQIY